MKAKAIVLPGLALGAALMLIGPSEEGFATFQTNGDSLFTSQRDVRLFNNYSDPQSNNNGSTTGNFPGWFGAEQATWKAIVEWGSRPHGTGGGDPSQPVLGSGGANFDASWQGNAAAVGGTNDNIISAVNSCSGGTIAFAESPYSNGWRIRMCDNSWIFADGPGGIFGNEFDIQGITVHEYGHCLGLGHSCTGAATMFASGALGALTERSIHPDDTAGIQAVYGVRSATKPTICETSAGGGMLTIKGSFFDGASNAVWFTNSAVTATGADPRVRVLGVPATNGGTEITVAIPAGAGPGDVLVKVPGGSNGTGLSNAFPFNPTGTITNNGLCEFLVTSVNPVIVPQLSPGPAQDVTIRGVSFDQVTELAITGEGVIDPSRWTIVNPSTITVDLPQLPIQFGAYNLEIKTPFITDSIGFFVQEDTTPTYQVGTGVAGHNVFDGDMMSVIIAGAVGTTHRAYSSFSSVPSCHPVAKFLMGNNFSDLTFVTVVTIPAAGYVEILAPITWSGSPTVFYTQTIDISTSPSPMFGISNLQSITVNP